jgi:beta-galactosidase
LLREVYRRAGIPIEDLPAGVFLEWRDGLWVAVNYNPAPFTVALPPGARILRGRNPVAPAGILVWR